MEIHFGWSWKVMENDFPKRVVTVFLDCDTGTSDCLDVAACRSALQSAPIACRSPHCIPANCNRNTSYPFPNPDQRSHRWPLHIIFGNLSYRLCLLYDIIAAMARVPICTAYLKCSVYTVGTGQLCTQPLPNCFSDTNFTRLIYL